ncbi:PfkB family carbohydrate kinase, partial [Streptomyces sp. PSAA01]|uniref:1-phosphofructokinase family hexose kinase n=1 Tax=Streptomyces sp. PSAA01 TaxID=2912762 RepID=UPI001F201ABC
MILTVTLNTALDVTYRVPELRPHATHRVTEVTERPGGKGLNVARVLAALGHDTVVTGFVGGVTGGVLRRLLGGIAVPGTGPGAPHGTITDALVPIAGTTRRTIGVVDATTGDTTQLNEPGPIVTTPEWSTFMDAYGRLLREASAVALCGSLPPGVPVGTYAQLIREAHAAGVPTLLDTSGEPLRRGIAARPHLVKPNIDELAGLTGSTDP